MLLGLIVGPIILFKTTKSFSALLQKNKKTEDKMVEFTKIIYFDDSLCFNPYIFICKFKYLSCLIGQILNSIINFIKFC